MKFWIFVIDWRSMAIEILGEFDNEAKAIKGRDSHIKSLSGPERDDLVRCKTLGITPVSNDMEFAVEQFKRFNGRVA